MLTASTSWEDSFPIPKYAGRLSFPLSESMSLVTSQPHDCYTMEEYAMSLASEPMRQLIRAPCMAANSEAVMAVSVGMLPLPSYLRRAREGWREYRDWSSPTWMPVCQWVVLQERDHMLWLTVSMPTVYSWGRLWLIVLKISLPNRISLIDEDRGQLKCRTARGHGELYQMHVVMDNGKRLVNEWMSKPDLHQKPNCINIFLSVYYSPDIILSDFHILFNSHGGQETEGPFFGIKIF